MTDPNPHAAEYLFGEHLRKFLTSIEGVVYIAMYDEEDRRVHRHELQGLNLPRDIELVLSHITSLPNLEISWAFYPEIGTGDDRLVLTFERWSMRAQKERRNKQHDRNSSLRGNFDTLRRTRRHLAVLAYELGRLVPQFGESIAKLQTFASDTGNTLDTAITEMNISLSTVHPIVMRDTSKNIG